MRILNEKYKNHHIRFKVDAPSLLIKKSSIEFGGMLSLGINAEAHHWEKVVYMIESIQLYSKSSRTGMSNNNTFKWFQTTEFAKVLSCLQAFFRNFLGANQDAALRRTSLTMTAAVGGEKIVLRLADNIDLIE